MIGQPTVAGGRPGPAAGLELILPARRLAATEVLDLGRRAEALGWAGVWVSEVLALDAFAMISALAGVTERVRLGTSIVPVSTRSTALLAMSISTVAQLAPDRVAVGLGVSTPAIVGRRHDRPVHRPVAETRGTLEVLGGLLRGRRLSHEKDPAVADLYIEPPDRPPPILLAALGPRMTELAYERADGLILNLVPLAGAAQAAVEGRRRVGDRFEVLVSQRVCVDPTDVDLVAIRREIASYCRVEVYADNLCRLGWNLDAVRAADPSDAGAMLPDALLNELVILGSAGECRRRLDEFRSSGVNPLVVPVGSDDSTGRLLDTLSLTTTPAFAERSPSS